VARGRRPSRLTIDARARTAEGGGQVTRETEGQVLGGGGSGARRGSSGAVSADGVSAWRSATGVSPTSPDGSAGTVAHAGMLTQSCKASGRWQGSLPSSGASFIDW
jgi:hypothetical protein